MNGRSGTFVTILVGIATVAATRFQDILAHAALLWPSIILAAVLVSLAFSWSWTQAFKFFFVDVDLQTPPNTTGMSSVAEMQTARTAWENQVRRAKREIYACAMLTCLPPATSSGAVLWLFNLDHKFMVVFVVLWGTAALGLSALSPWLWRQVFEVFVPWLLMMERRHD